MDICPITSANWYHIVCGSGVDHKDMYTPASLSIWNAGKVINSKILYLAAKIYALLQQPDYFENHPWATDPV